VPGCGLKCSVSQIETVLNSSTTDVEIMNTRNSTTSFCVTYHIPDEASGAVATIEGNFQCILISFYCRISYFLSLVL